MSLSAVLYGHYSYRSLRFGETGFGVVDAAAVAQEVQLGFFSGGGDDIASASQVSCPSRLTAAPALQRFTIDGCRDGACPMRPRSGRRRK